MIPWSAVRPAPSSQVDSPSKEMNAARITE